jgi:hypothetical protein
VRIFVLKSIVGLDFSSFGTYRIYADKAPSWAFPLVLSSFGFEGLVMKLMGRRFWRDFVIRKKIGLKLSVCVVWVSDAYIF